ncbi:hypothetical protein QQS21_008262 [Conoideocrella luteorostrata]|uniref:Laccase n=1 Tax=Conoideocrella luteorostrata TaxID=1105319 RepID=A0AAJ0FWP4_9HYPO|nr:hypothetical protein QQS21_008262 [Conoideocrella luteorostrata]
MAVNGSIPGPTLFADWGDMVIVHVKNSLTLSNNGTSIHFHGIRQNFTNQNDGVTSITQCPIAVGETATYTWKAVQYGTAWYHSHFGLQAWQGVFGGIVINGPASQNYDEDLGMLFLNDWDHSTADQLYTAAETDGPPILATGLINGTNVYGNLGKWLSVSFKPGKSYRIRLVNSAMDTHFKFMIDHHIMTVMAADLVPVVPYQRWVLDIAIGQRYDIIVLANQASTAKNFWMRAIPQLKCSRNAEPENIRAIVSYDDEPSEPTTSAYKYIDSCDDETHLLRPIVSRGVGDADMQLSSDVDVERVDGLFKWTLNNTTMIVDWNKPTLMQVVRNSRDFINSNAVIELPEKNKWVYMVITTTILTPHPIHLHGHDFYVLAQGRGPYSQRRGALKRQNNPARRDTVVLPGGGHLVLAFETNNPGAWLMHCHIGWHTSEGFALQLLERYNDIPALTDGDEVDRICKSWSAFKISHGIIQEDSGV